MSEGTPNTAESQDQASIPKLRFFNRFRQPTRVLKTPSEAIPQTVDKIAQQNTFTTDITPSLLLESKPLTASEVLSIPIAIEAAWKDDPEYAITLADQLKFLQDIENLVQTRQITKEQANAAKAAKLTEGKLASDYDDLTEMLKRGALDRKLASTLGIARRAGRSYSLALGDLDRFKLVNDTSGHAAGDAVLRNTAGFILSSVRRSSDIVGRYGGEEIVIGYPNANEEWTKLRTQEMLTQMPIIVGDMISQMDIELPNPVTMSIGIAEYIPDLNDKRSDEEIIAELYAKADARMYLAKNNGRNQIVGSVEEQEILTKIESSSDASSGLTH